MIQFSALMWTCALFFGFLGLMRGWNRELVATAGIVLAMFAVFQFDAMLRSTIFRVMSPDQIVLLQCGVFVCFAFISYQTRFETNQRRNQTDSGSWQTSFLGGVVGFINGYLMGGTLWYFFDINEYPAGYVLAPSATSPSSQSIGMMPMVLLGGGTSGSGDLLALMVIVLLFVVIWSV